MNRKSRQYSMKRGKWSGSSLSSRKADFSFLMKMITGFYLLKRMNSYLRRENLFLSYESEKQTLFDEKKEMVQK